jgi:phenylalanyl-tRNA synthetase beta chain
VRISEQWLREWVDPAQDSDGLARQLTMAGLEVDAVEPVAGNFSGVLVAEITAAEPHPGADKLRVCSVDCGAGEAVQIVCGAPNARVGLKAPLATVGAVLPGEHKIRRAKLRGVESRGMLCAEAELGLSDAAEGLMELPAEAPVGAPLGEALGLDDTIIEVELTPNRADCLGMRGIAREMALLNDLTVTGPAIEPVDPASDERFPVTLSAPARCPRYLGRVIRGADLSRPSPLWLQERLRRGGIRSIDAVVDVTNYVLLELGQPMHAFDLDRLEGGIDVRLARVGETLALLNGNTVELAPDNLVIADRSGPLALAGIMGGEGSGVSATTRNLFLEAAFFAPAHLSGQARRFGLHTDSSHRFERGVDFTLQRLAMERATALLLGIVGGEPGPISEELAESELPLRPPVTLRAARIKRILGISLDAAEVERILRGLGLGLAVAATEDGWRCEIPPWRFDLTIEADLLEELARVHGYHHLPATRSRAELAMPPRPEAALSPRLLRRQLVARGYHEAITYSFQEPALQALFDPALEPVALRNPISSDMAVMRTSLIPGLVATAQRNLNRQQLRPRLFETGLRFRRRADNSLDQRPTLALLIGGRARPEGWSGGRDAVDFYDLKGDLEGLFALARRSDELAFVAAERPALHPGQTAAILVAGEELGVIGALHPDAQAALDLERPLFVAEIDLAALLAARVPAFQPVSRYPEIRRDLAVIVDREVPAAELMANVRATAGPYCDDLRLFDVYAGKGIDPKRKSLALGLTFRDQTRTLADEEVTQAVQQVIDSLVEKYNAELRGQATSE